MKHNIHCFFAVHIFFSLYHHPTETLVGVIIILGSRSLRRFFTILYVARRSIMVSDANKRACSAVGTVIVCIVATLVLLFVCWSFANDYMHTLQHLRKDRSRVIDNWRHHCSDDREVLPHEIAQSCTTWKTAITYYQSTGMYNLAAAQIIDRWGAWCFDALGTQMMRAGHAIIFYAIMFVFALVLLMFLAIVLLLLLPRRILSANSSAMSLPVIGASLSQPLALPSTSAQHRQYASPTVTAAHYDSASADHEMRRRVLLDTATVQEMVD